MSTEKDKPCKECNLSKIYPPSDSTSSTDKSEYCCKEFNELKKHFEFDYKNRLVKGYPNGDIYEFDINYCPFCGTKIGAETSE